MLFGKGKMANEKIIYQCIGCGKYLDAKGATQKQRCASCREAHRLAGRFGSLLVQGVVTQRELAQIKKEFYALYKVDQRLEQRRERRVFEPRRCNAEQQDPG